ncbi:hypothetical protein SKAU_G00017680 [Synaphobranchus kaupii]|uniref:Uncharacterized protein n=1 Tax=Synaphobranchus kaupii TaxID=118154 RepID=A0A9Q1GB95_SYNKA|nr:hypothetical protein SKAU_G00017680 [Synaphobranchus kaupii]
MRTILMSASFNARKRNDTKESFIRSAASGRERSDPDPGGAGRGGAGPGPSPAVGQGHGRGDAGLRLSLPLKLISSAGKRRRGCSRKHGRTSSSRMSLRNS